MYHHQKEAFITRNQKQDVDITSKLNVAHITLSSYDLLPFGSNQNLNQLWNTNLYNSAHHTEQANSRGSRSPDLLWMEDKLSSSSTVSGYSDDPIADLTPTGLTWNLPPENPSETKDEKRRKSCISRGRYLRDGTVRKRVRFEDIHLPNTECKICNLQYDLSQDDDSELSLGPGDPFEVNKKCKRH
eukprot:760371-Hanusia_phi.AAC.3